MTDTSNLPPIPPEIAALTPYEPGKPIEELERELGISGAIKLASNENPLGPSPKAIEAVRRGATRLHRYPDGAGFELRQALAARFGLQIDNVCLANGSNEIIEFLCRAFIRPGDDAVAAQYAFSMYEKLVAVAGGVLREVALDDFHIDLEAMLAAVGPRTRLVFVNSPHNPAGTAVTRAQFAAFLERLPGGVVVVVDEAYVDFASDPETLSGLEFLGHAKPVVVMRTFSKAYGLAGLRIGYGLAPAPIVAVFNRVRQAFNTSIPAQEGALAALSDEDFLRRAKEITWRGLRDFYACFERLGLWYAPSQANFVLTRIGPRAGEVFDQLLRRGVIVRKMHSYHLPEHLRVSVGLPEENARFIRELTDILGGGAA